MWECSDAGPRSLPVKKVNDSKRKKIDLGQNIESPFKTVDLKKRRPMEENKRGGPKIKNWRHLGNSYK